MSYLMNQLLLLLWLDQQSREARILRCGASQDWEIRTESVPFSEGESCLIQSGGVGDVGTATAAVMRKTDCLRTPRR
jgi:hypothetical protein